MENRKRTPLKPVKKASPEREHFKKLIGRQVVVYLLNTEEYIEGKLIWVDAYTLLISRNNNGGEELVYKHGIERIKALEPEAKAHRGHYEKHRKRVV